MQENNFITKITGRGEIPINKMPGFHPPNNEEHEYILQRVEKNLKKEITTSVLWLIISLMISVFYLYMYITSNADNKKYMLIASAVFFIMARISIYRLAVVDKMVDDIIKNRKYKLRTAKIRHLMPGFGTNLAKIEAKVQDEHGNVYSYEFVLNRKLVKKFKKEPETEFLIVKLSEKKEMYSITLPPENIKNDNNEVDKI